MTSSSPWEPADMSSMWLAFCVFGGGESSALATLPDIGLYCQTGHWAELLAGSNFPGHAGSR